MIYTITVNPSIDYVMQVEDFLEGKVNRAETTMYYPGGKGINVSRVLKRLGTDTTALGFIAGFTGNFIKEKLMDEQVAVQLIEVEGNSRINVKLKVSQETEINGTGPVVDEGAVDRLLKQLDHLKSTDYVVLAGSIPNTVPSTIYQTIMNKCKEHDAKVVVDTGGAALKELLEYQPFLIKPNHHELGDLFGVTISSKEEAIHYAEKVHEQGVQNIVVSMAGDGALLYSNEGVFVAQAPKGVVKNSVGAGDSLVAGFLAGFIKNNDAKEALKNGIATGSATAFSHDLCQREEVEKLLSHVSIEKL
jgi:1-phosphofructokinase